MSWTSPSLETAEFISGIANWTGVGALIVGLVSTWLVVWMGNIKEAHLKLDVASANASSENAKAEAAIAKQKAAEASLEQERLKREMAWRRLSDEQVKSLKTSLADHKVKITIMVLGSDPETSQYSLDFEAVFKSMNFEVKREISIAPKGGNFGIFVGDTHESDEWRLIIKAFKNAEIPIQSAGKTKGLQLFIAPKAPPLP